MKLECLCCGREFIGLLGDNCPYCKSKREHCVQIIRESVWRGVKNKKYKICRICKKYVMNLRQNFHEECFDSLIEKLESNKSKFLKNRGYKNE